MLAAGGGHRTKREIEILALYVGDGHHKITYLLAGEQSYTW